MIQFGAKFFLKLIFLMSTTKQLSLIQRLYHKKTTTNNCLGEVKCSVNIRQRWSLLSVSHLKLAIDLIPPRSGLHIKPMLWYCSSETDELCVCVSVCRAHSCSPGSGHYQKKKCIQTCVLSIDSYSNCNIPQKSSSAPANTHSPSLLKVTSFIL